MQKSLGFHEETTVLTLFSLGDENIFYFLMATRHTTSRSRDYIALHASVVTLRVISLNVKKVFLLPYLTDLCESFAIISCCWDQ